MQKVILCIPLIANIVILSLVLKWMWSASADAQMAYGPDSPSRRILTCIYFAITVASAAGLVILRFVDVHTAMLLITPLLGLQIIYKLLSVAAIGFTNPVIISNAIIAVVYAGLLFLVWVIS